MRKTILILAVGSLVMAAVGGPALAAKKKSGSFSAQAVPFPGPDGCNSASGGIEDVHLVNEPFKAPFSGLLTVTMAEFEGDWDLFLTDPDGNTLVSATESQLTGSPPTEEVVFSLKKGTEVLMSPCNWAGGPGATVNWEFVALK